MRCKARSATLPFAKYVCVRFLIYLSKFSTSTLIEYTILVIILIILVIIKFKRFFHLVLDYPTHIFLMVLQLPLFGTPTTNRLQSLPSHGLLCSSKNIFIYFFSLHYCVKTGGGSGEARNKWKLRSGTDWI